MWNEPALTQRTPVSRIELESFSRVGAELWLKREELRDPLLGGNKWHKLQGHLQAARLQGRGRLLSFGGAWSNHLHALAAAGQRFGFETVGVVRGPEESAMLADCRRFGMQIIAVSYGEYRLRDDPAWIAELIHRHGLGDCHVVPEGGGGAAGLVGLAALAQELEADLGQGNGAVLALAMGTGTTLAGLAAHLSPKRQIWGFPVLPLPAIEQKLAKWLSPFQEHAPYTVWHGQVDTTYGRLKPEWRQFLDGFERRHPISLDPIYTVKLLWALNRLAEQGCIPKGTRIVALHGGGLQGRRGFALPAAIRAA